jgi:hypothetical protein
VVDKFASLPAVKGRRDAGVTKIDFGKKRQALVPSEKEQTKPDRAPLTHWSIELPGRSARDASWSLGSMRAPEEMFFLGSPLAHVVCFEALQGSKT